MDTPRSYQYDRDATSGMWRIVSPSGHLLYQSRWHVHVARVCQRLNSRFSTPRTEAPVRPSYPRQLVPAALVA